MENKQTAEKLTAMEQLINWIDSDCSPMDCVMKAKELLAIEKEQIKDAYLESSKQTCWSYGEEPPSDDNMYAEDYYNKTYANAE